MERVAGQLARAGAVVVGRELPAAFDGMEAAHAVVMNGESARAMGWEMAHHRERISDALREKLEWGLAQGGRRWRRRGGCSGRCRRGFRRCCRGWTCL